MRVNQLVSDYPTLSREQGWTLVKDQPKLAIKHLLSVVKPAQRKDACENDLQLDQIELCKEFYGFVNHLRKTAADADRWKADNHTGKDTRSSDKASTGGFSKSYTRGFSSGSRHSTAKDSTCSTSQRKSSKCRNDMICNKGGKTDYHCMADCPNTAKEAERRFQPSIAQLRQKGLRKLSRRSSPPRRSGASHSRPRTPRLPRWRAWKANLTESLS
jgi:hypothetical protein